MVNISFYPTEYQGSTNGKEGNAMLKLFLVFLVTVIAMVVVAQAVGAEAIAEVLTNPSDSHTTVETSAQATGTQSTSPYHNEVPGISGGGCGAVPK